MIIAKCKMQIAKCKVQSDEALIAQFALFTLAF